MRMDIVIIQQNQSCVISLAQYRKAYTRTMHCSFMAVTTEHFPTKNCDKFLISMDLQLSRNTLHIISVESSSLLLHSIKDVYE